MGLNPLTGDATGAIVTTLEMHCGSGPYLTLRHRRNLAVPRCKYLATQPPFPAHGISEQPSSSARP